MKKQYAIDKNLCAWVLMPVPWLAANPIVRFWQLAYTGSSFAGVVMTRLVVYFLAIPDLYQYFIAKPNFALAMKKYVVAMSYPRNGLVNTV